MVTNSILFLIGTLAVLYVIFKVYVALYTEYLLITIRTKHGQEEFDKCSMFVIDGCNGYSWSAIKALKKIAE